MNQLYTNAKQDRGVKKVKPLRVADLSLLSGVVYHPRMSNVEFFLTEYARALQVDMMQRQAFYRGVSFDFVYEKMALAIVHNNCRYWDSPAVRHACRCVGIPPRAIYVQAYIWGDQDVPIVLINRRERVRSRHKNSLDSPNYGELRKPPKRIQNELPDTLP